MQTNRMKPSISRRFLVLATGVVFVIVLYFYKTSFIHSKLCPERQLKIQRKFLNPPQLTETEERSLAHQYSKDNQLLADRLSKIVHSQLKTIQTTESCNVPNFVCGHYGQCGFACQAHHRSACLMISYALSMPLIHNEEEGWPYSKKWSDVFEPLGTNCLPGNNTFRWSWEHTALYRGTPCYFSYETSDQIEYPMLQGLPVSRKLADLVEKIHPNPFLWWVGQFMKYALRPKANFTDTIQKGKKTIGFVHPVLGTDKLEEASDSHHEIEEYVKAAENWLQKESQKQLVDTFNQTISRCLFVASDDSKVLPSVQKNHPDWIVTGFLSNETLWNPNQRKDALEDIVRDVLILSECDYIVCGLSSNVCRLIMELQCGKYIDCQKNLANVDTKRNYQFILQGGHSLSHLSIIKVDP